MPRSPFFYVGDKYKLISQLIPFFPPNINTLIEPFCGGGSVFLNIKAKKYEMNDKNSYMIALHEYLRSFANKQKLFFKMIEEKIIYYGLSASYLGLTIPEELKKKYVKTHYAVYNKVAYQKLRDDYNQDKSNLLYLYLLLVYGFNHMIRFNGSGDFNLPVGNVDYNRNVHQALETYFTTTKNLEINFENLDFVEFLRRYSFQKDDFVYLDPPYLISKCEYNKGWTQENDDALLKLLDYLDSQGIKFALSNVLVHKGNVNEKLKKWAQNYHVHQDLQSNYISYHDNTIKNTVEVLITNY